MLDGMDVVAEVLRALDLRGTVYFRADFRAPWGMSIQGTGVANFHIVVRGACTLRDHHNRLTTLGPGDIALFPRGDAHALKSSPDTPSVPAAELLAAPRQQEATKVFGGEGTPTTLICGHFELDDPAGHPLARTLPEAMVVRADEHEDPSWVQTATDLAARESERSDGAASPIVDRLAEVLLAQVLRAYLVRHADDPGFLAALRDGGLARALEAMHTSPEKPWTVDELARVATMSRSSFIASFSDKVGEPPMRYLTRWRMLVAQDLLRGDATLGSIAERVGYQSEFAFAKAFKRVMGMPPGQARRDRSA
jgi:AraC-like DNA-binding protein